MKRIIKLTERDLTRIVRRVIREQDDTVVPNLDGSEDTSVVVSDCYKLLKRKEDDGSIGGSSYNDLEISGDVEVSYNSTVSPNSRSVTIMSNGKPFCKIPVSSGIGDCSDYMETSSDAPGSPMMATLDSPVKINITGSVSPEYRGMIIKDAGGYFCTVPSSTIPESRRRRY